MDKRMKEYVLNLIENVKTLAGISKEIVIWYVTAILLYLYYWCSQCSDNLRMDDNTIYLLIKFASECNYSIIIDSYRIMVLSHDNV